MIDFCTVVVLDFVLKKVYLQANSLHLVAAVGIYTGSSCFFWKEVHFINKLLGLIHTAY